MITSAANPKVKLLRSLVERKNRRALGLCLVEGVRLMTEALDSGLAVGPILYAPDRLSATATGRALRPRLERLRDAEEIDLRVLDGLAGTVSSQGVIAAAAIPSPRPLPDAGLLLVLDGVADPGNAGTMLRTSWAAGVSAVVATRRTTDLWSPKAVRSGMGAHFHLRLHADMSWPLELGSRQLLLAVAGDGAPYWEIDWSKPTALVIGSEAHGLSSSAWNAASQLVTIPMAPGAESLNAAAAAAVLLFAARRTLGSN